MTFGIASLGIGLGAVFPRFRYENVAQIPTGFGGIAYMLITMIFIGAVVALEAWPVYRIFMTQTAGGALPRSGWVGIIASFGMVILINALMIILPMKIGLKRLMEREI
jgi:ABC-2 type transport system permease protein